MRLILALLLFLSTSCQGQVILGFTTSSGSLDLAGKTVTIIGTSITEQYNASPSTNRYATVLCGLINATEDNQGVASSMMCKRAPNNPIGGVNMQDRLSDIPTYNSGTYAALIFEFGMNDAGYNGANYTTANFTIDYQAALDNAFSKGWPTNRILLLSNGYVLDAAFAFYDGINGGESAPDRTRFESFVAAVAQLAIDNDVMYLDMYAAMEANSPAALIDTDGVHPVNAGHAFMASEIESFLISNYTP
jgi:lysophospholipase L1-like esterase